MVDPNETEHYKKKNLLASRRFLAFDSKMPMELQVDRQMLPMERYRLKEDRKDYETK
jgi:hypothetical protein